MKKYLFIALLLLSTTFYASETTDVSKLDKALATAVEKGLVLAEKTGIFVIEQAPELIQEFYQWHLYENIFYIVIGLFFGIGGYFLSFKVAKKIDEYEYFETPVPSFIFLTGPVGFGFFTIKSIYDLIFLIVAPKLYLIEYFIK